MIQGSDRAIMSALSSKWFLWSRDMIVPLIHVHTPSSYLVTRKSMLLMSRKAFIRQTGASCSQIDSQSEGSAQSKTFLRAHSDGGCASVVFA